MKLTRTDTNETICTLNAIYGKELGMPGNELGFLVGIEDQQFEEPMRLSKSTPVELVAIYNATELHAGVMSLFRIQYLDKKYAPEDATTHGDQIMSTGSIFADVCHASACDLKAVGFSSMPGDSGDRSQLFGEALRNLKAKAMIFCGDPSLAKECRDWRGNIAACAKKNILPQSAIVLAIAVRPSISFIEVQGLDKQTLAKGIEAIPPCVSTDESSSDHMTPTSNVSAQAAPKEKTRNATSSAHSHFGVSMIVFVLCPLMIRGGSEAS